MINTIANQPFQIHLDLLKKQTKNRHIVRIILPFLHFRLTPGIKRCVRSRCACVQCVFVCVFKGSRWCFSYRCKTPFEQFLVKTDNFPWRHLYGLVRSFDIFFFFLDLLVVFLMVTISKFQIVFFSSEDNKTFISLLFLKSDNLKLAEIYLFRCSFVV